MSGFFLGIILPLLFVLLTTGAAVLSRRTRRVPAVVQFVACFIILVTLLVEHAANYLMRVEKPQLFDLIHRSDVLLGSQIVLIICFLAFPVSYLWYALTQKRI